MQEFIESDKSQYIKIWKNDLDKLQSQSLQENKNSEQTENELYDSDVEQNIQESVGNIDTLVDDTNLENRTLIFAPGENQWPLSIYKDVHFEYLCFPTIFCGSFAL